MARFDPEEAGILRGELEASRSDWSTSESYNLIRARANEIGQWRNIVRLEIAGGPGGPGYSSVWFIETGEQVVELVTDPASVVVRERIVLSGQWKEFKESVKHLTASGVASRASPFLVDGPAYYFCAIVGGQESSFIIYDMPEDVPEFRLLERVLALSAFKRVPQDLQAKGDR